MIANPEARDTRGGELTPLTRKTTSVETTRKSSKTSTSSIATGEMILVKGEIDVERETLAHAPLALNQRIVGGRR
jgi:hypothetical protein